LGVIHPDNPGQFLLGIECDGAAYHSARSARDRDRLRQEVLEGLGWKLHRIWSTDWFRNPSRETEKALAAIKGALDSPPSDKLQGTARRPVNSDKPAPDETTDASQTGNVNKSSSPPASQPYREAKLPYVPNPDIFALSLRQMLDICLSVIRVEGPVHSEEVARRVREAFGLGRTGPRILAIIVGALSVGRTSHVLVADGDFWDIPDRVIELPRDRRAAAPSSRRADRIAPKEYKKAIELALVESVALYRDKLIIETARSLGFDRTGVDLQTAIGLQIDKLVESGEILESETGLRQAVAARVTK
jgi:hypothetical protein